MHIDRQAHNTSIHAGSWPVMMETYLSPNPIFQSCWGNSSSRKLVSSIPQSPRNSTASHVPLMVLPNFIFVLVFSAEKNKPYQGSFLGTLVFFFVCFFLNFLQKIYFQNLLDNCVHTASIMTTTHFSCHFLSVVSLDSHPPVLQD